MRLYFVAEAPKFIYVLTYWMEKAMSYFPLLILLVDDNKKLVVNTPQEIPSGKTFKVLKTNF